MDIDTFRDTYEEFDKISEAYVITVLVQAASHTNPAAFGVHYDEAHGLEAAILLWDSPFGATIRLDGDDKDDRKSRYQKQRERLIANVVDTSVVVTETFCRGFTWF